MAQGADVCSHTTGLMLLTLDSCPVTAVQHMNLLKANLVFLSIYFYGTVQPKMHMQPHTPCCVKSIQETCIGLLYTTTK